jgi:ABC transport system ATP-binding/permease protein
MTVLLRFDEVSLSFGDQQVLKAASFAVEPGEKICLIGRNGAGKSTTLKLISGVLEPDEGSVERPASLRMSMLDQQLAEGSPDLVRDVVAQGMAHQLELLDRYRTLSQARSADRAVLRELEQLERQIEAGGGWSVDAQVQSMISQLDLPADQPMQELSGGWRRRVALAQALVSNPQLLLLDEPTNHLDISTIEWLEQQVRRYAGAVLFVTHDRSFVEGIATRIVDIDRGQLRSWPGAYREYLRRKAEAELTEDRHNELFDRRLAEEETWIRQGIKAREHRNEGRVRALEAMREERAQRIARPRAPRIHVNESGETAGRKVIEARNISHGYGDNRLLEDFSLRVMKGDRIGIVGNNGVGKSTLLQILLGNIVPEKGTLKLGTNLEIAYFDQLRRELDTSRTVADIVGEGRDYIAINGRKKHVVGYLTDFLFTAKRAMTRVEALSGGERNRVILAKLFTRPANLLVLDEPTNDLDVETLEALEARLRQYQGTLIVVSHDRYFLDAVVSSVLVFEGDGVVKRYAGGYSDWTRLKHRLAGAEDMDAAARPATRASNEAAPQADQSRASAAPRKLSYKLQRELSALPDRIATLEAQLSTRREAVNDPAFYQREREIVDAELRALAELEGELEAAVERWAELESLSEQAAGHSPQPR